MQKRGAEQEPHTPTPLRPALGSAARRTMRTSTSIQIWDQRSALLERSPAGQVSARSRCTSSCQGLPQKRSTLDFGALVLKVDDASPRAPVEPSSGSRARETPIMVPRDHNDLVPVRKGWSQRATSASSSSVPRRRRSPAWTNTSPPPEPDRAPLRRGGCQLTASRRMRARPDGPHGVEGVKPAGPRRESSFPGPQETHDPGQRSRGTRVTRRHRRPRRRRRAGRTWASARLLPFGPSRRTIMRAAGRAVLVLARDDGDHVHAGLELRVERELRDLRIGRLAVRLVEDLAGADEDEGVLHRVGVRRLTFDAHLVVASRRASPARPRAAAASA